MPPLPDWATDPDATRESTVPSAPRSNIVSRSDHCLCTSRCAEFAVPSPLLRDRPPTIRCDWCGAPPGVACTWRAPGGRVRPLSVYGRFHPSRLKEARAA